MIQPDESSAHRESIQSPAAAPDEVKVKPSFPGKFEVSELSDGCRKLPDGVSVSIAGRIKIIRDLGGVIFAVLSDRGGTIQICMTKKHFGDQLPTVRQQLASGCFVGLHGETSTSRSGERTVDVKQFCLLQSPVKPLPQKYTPKSAGSEKERYLEMLMDPEVRNRFEVRSATLSHIRRYLEQAGFCEVETPILQPGDSGAVAEHFVTHHNFLGSDVYLRISPETYLKQAVIGGVDRVFEIGKVFRNEGRSRQHLQEFTVLECYSAFTDHVGALEFTRDLLRSVVKRIHGSAKFTYQGSCLDFEGQWPEHDIRTLVSKAVGLDIRYTTDVKAIAEHAQREHGLYVDTRMSYDRVVESIFRRTALKNLPGPAVIGNYPAGANPLTRISAKDPAVLDKYRLVIGGSEVVHICAEEINPGGQKARLQDQQRTRKASDESMRKSRDDFVNAVEYGLPPLAGIGIGLDRLIAILTDRPSLRDVVLFPL